MAELNVHGVGVATADPELKFIGDDKTPVCNVNLAFNRSYKKKGSDKWEQETAFMRAQVFGRRAETMAGLVKKGLPVYINGHVTQSNWTSEAGDKRMALLITVHDFQMCQKFVKSNNNNSSSNEPKQEVPVNVPNTDDDIPF